MPKTAFQSSGPVVGGLLLAVSAFLLAWATCGWLTDPQVSGALWPGDINANVVALLGGTSHRGVLGQAVSSLHPLSVWWRILLFVGICGGAIRVAVPRLRGKQPGFPFAAVFRQATTVFAAGASWWLIYLAGDFAPPVKSFAVGVVPIWVWMCAAFLVWIWWRPCLSLSDSSFPSVPSVSRPLVVLGLLTVAWAGVSFWMNYCLYQQLFIPHGDSAMYEEHLWNVWHGKGFRSYLDQGLFLGEHLQVIHLLLLPLHMLWPSHLLLELVESSALAACAVPIYLMTRRHTGSRWAAAVMGIAWLFYFPMHFLDIAIDQKTFRPIALGLPFLFWLIEFCERRQFGKATICLIVALSAKEDVALITAPLLGVLAVQAMRHRQSHESDRRAVWRLAMMSVFSLLYLLAAVLIVIPAFRSGDVVHYSRYFGDLGNSPADLLRTAIAEPGRILAQVFSVRTMLYTVVFLAPLAFMPVRKPIALLAGVLTFGMLSLLQFGDAAGLPPVPYHHFHAPLLPVLFWSAILGLGTVKDQTTEVRTSLCRWSGFDIPSQPLERAGLVLCCCVATAVTGSMMPCGVSFWSGESAFGYRRLYLPEDSQQVERAAMVGEVLRQVPMSARVASTDFIHTRLTHCERSYDYSSYLRAVNNYQPGVPADTDYIVIDTHHRYSEIRTASDVPQLQASNEWQLLPDTTNGAFLILKRQ